MRYKTLDDFDFKGKLVVLRSDLNSEISKGKVILSDRIIESAKTISELKKKGARVVIIAHQSRKGKPDFISLKQHSKLLNKYSKVSFVEDTIGEKAKKEVLKLKNGEAILLENIRFIEGETDLKKKYEITNFFKDFDIYVNDAFSVCHREQTSITEIPRLMKHCMGRTLEKELESLKKIRIKNCLFILGGAKGEENYLLMNHKNVLTGGIFGQLCIISSGINLGAQNEFLKDNEEMIKKMKKYSGKVKTPIDLAVNKNGKRVELDVLEFPSEYNIFDIGKKTQDNYIKEIKKAKAIFMKGTLGYCEDKKFSTGTARILKAIAQTKGFSVLAGGHTSSELRKLRIRKEKFSYISLSGGATVEFLSGKKLPGLEALK